MGTAVVFAGGPASRTGRAGVLPDPSRVDVVVAADSGLDLAVALGWRVDLVVGDMDSVAPSALDRAEAQGATIERHPEDKDATDLELALHAATREGIDHVVVVGSAKGRMDHLLGAALVLAGPRFAHVRVDGWLGGALVVPVHDRRTIAGVPGSYLSILAVHGPALGVTTEGLRWPLRGERLDPGSTRGISNELIGARAEVSVEAGTVLVVVPAHGTDRPEPNHHIEEQPS